MKALALVLALCAYASHASTYTISSAEDFADIANDVKYGKDFEYDTILLTSDLDLCDISPNFEPIGTDDARFKGTFNGNGHVIYNLRFYDSSFLKSMYVGMFGYSKKATFENVVFDASCYMQSQYSDDKMGQIGMLTGFCEDCTINSVVNMGEVEYSGIFGFDEYEASIGGIVGQAYKDVMIRNVMNFGTVTFSGDRTSVLVGGIVGKLRKSDIKNCANYGDISIDGDADKSLAVGGIVGYGKDEHSVRNVLNMGRIRASKGPSTSYIANIIGLCNGGEIQFAYWADNTNYNVATQDGSQSKYSASSTSKFDSSFKKTDGGMVIDSLNMNLDLTTYLRWGLKTMYLNSGSIGKFDKKFVGSDGSIKLPVFIKQLPTPSKDEHVFEAWYSDRDRTVRYNNNAGIGMVYAGWEYENATCEFSGTAEKKTFGFLALVAFTVIALIF